MTPDEIGHLIRQHVLATIQTELRPVYGHVATYDIKSHSVTVLIPSLLDPISGAYQVSPEMPLAMVGGPTGQLHYHPLSGATQEKPTAGEQVMLSFFGRGGIGAVVGSFCSAANPPVGNNLPQNDPMQPGEFMVGLAGGNYVRVRANGGVDIQSNKIRIGGLTQTLRKLLDIRFFEWFNEHTHPANGQPPAQQIIDDNAHTTTNLTAN